MDQWSDASYPSIYPSFSSVGNEITASIIFSTQKLKIYSKKTTNIHDNVYKIQFATTLLRLDTVSCPGRS